MSENTTAIEVLWILVTVCGLYYPWRIIQRVNKDLDVINDDQLQTVSRLTPQQARIASDAPIIVRYLCWAVIATNVIFAVAGLAAAMTPPPNPDQPITPVSIIIVIALLGGVVSKSILVYFAAERMKTWVE